MSYRSNNQARDLPRRPLLRLLASRSLIAVALLALCSCETVPDKSDRAALLGHALRYSIGDAEFAVHECGLYQAVKERGEIYDWAKIGLEPADPNILGLCVDGDLWRTDEYLLFSNCYRQFSAGGGCSTHGQFRTHDGKCWESLEPRDDSAGRAWVPCASPVTSAVVDAPSVRHSKGLVFLAIHVPLVALFLLGLRRLRVNRHGAWLTVLGGGYALAVVAWHYFDLVTGFEAFLSFLMIPVALVVGLLAGLLGYSNRMRFTVGVVECVLVVGCGAHLLFP